MSAAPRSPSIVIDLATERLWIDDEAVMLRPKTWLVLRCLVERPGQILTKNELLDRVWPGTAVTEGTLNKSIGELRVALVDTTQSPRCIETVSRRGFRWIGDARVVAGRDVDGAAKPGRAATSEGSSTTDSGIDPPPALPEIIGRDADLALLEAGLARARSGRPQLIFVTGEAGAGKTTLLDRFLDEVDRRRGDAAVFVAHGQCLDTSGQHEPYLPVLEAIERLARRPDTGAEVTAVLRRCAPTWIEQMPSLPAQPAPAGAAAESSPGRMLRELTTAIEELARLRTLVLVLEDAHWADLATTDVCNTLARRRDPVRLMVLVTMRTADAMVTEHPILAVCRELVARRAAEEIGLTPFGGAELSAYLAARCPGLDSQSQLEDWLLLQTAGNPLFVRLVVDEWISRSRIAPDESGQWRVAGDADELRHTVPDSLRALLERQIAQLAPDERAVLDAASVRIGEFHAASIAPAAAADPEDVETLCRSIARRGQFLRACERATTAEGFVTEQFAFLHATVQQVVADELSGTRRRRLHLAAAEQLEREYAGRSRIAASQIAAHFEAAGEPARALPHLRDSAWSAMRRDSPRAAIVLLEKVLRLLEETDKLSDRDGERLLALSNLSHAHQLAYGFVHPRVAALWSQTSKLAVSREDARERLIADGGRIMVSCVSARYAEGEEVIREVLPLMPLVAEPGARQAFLFSSATVLYRVAAFDEARQMFESALALKAEVDPVPGADFVAVLMSQYAPMQALTGQAGAAQRLVQESVERARAHSHYSECVTGALAAWSLALLHDFAGAAPIAARALEFAEADSFHTWTTRPQFLLGMHDIREGRFEAGIARIRAALDARRGEGQWVDHSAFCCLSAEALLDAGCEGADAMLDEAAGFTESSGERYYDVELQRLRAKARRIAGGDPAEVEVGLRKAIGLAALRGVAWHGLLAASDLARLLLEQGRGDEVVSLLQPACAAVEGGDELPVMTTASALLRRAGAISGPSSLREALRFD
ncbi:MAG: AAA family ATPase [Candidatus Binatia bacterium]